MRFTLGYGELMRFTVSLCAARRRRASIPHPISLLSLAPFPATPLKSADRNRTLRNHRPAAANQTQQQQQEKQFEKQQQQQQQGQQKQRSRLSFGFFFFSLSLSLSLSLTLSLSLRLLASVVCRRAHSRNVFEALIHYHSIQTSWTLTAVETHFNNSDFTKPEGNDLKNFKSQ